MEQLSSFIGQINSLAWGVPMLVLILGTGLFISIGLKFMTIARIPFAFGLLKAGRIPNTNEKGYITPFNALMTSLSATIGTGNIAGVATAIFLGGPGAVFWMWMTALVGMATKYAEAVCAVRFREQDENGNFVGGPMYYIKNGMGDNWKWLATVFAIFAAIAGFGIGNTVQSNSVADALQTNFNIPPIATGVVIMSLVGLVLVGGLKSISTVAGRLVPLMATLYIIASLIVIIMHIEALPNAIGLIFTHALVWHVVFSLTRRDLALRPSPMRRPKQKALYHKALWQCLAPLSIPSSFVHSQPLPLSQQAHGQVVRQARH